jgi:hypothetical protein
MYAVANPKPKPWHVVSKQHKGRAGGMQKTAQLSYTCCCAAAEQLCVHAMCHMYPRQSAHTHTHQTHYTPANLTLIPLYAQGAYPPNRRQITVRQCACRCCAADAASNVKCMGGRPEQKCAFICGMNVALAPGTSS